MDRKILKDLITWKNNTTRKPLILRGARQVGKTYIIKQFGNEYYEILHILTLIMIKTYTIYLKIQKILLEY